MRTLSFSFIAVVPALLITACITLSPPDNVDVTSGFDTTRSAPRSVSFATAFAPLSASISNSSFFNVLPNE